MVVALFFAQFALTAGACFAASPARVEVIAPVSQDGCEMQRENPNLCLYHCTDQNNAGGTPQAALDAPVLAAQPVPAWHEFAMVLIEARTSAGNATGPPLPIRYCCFRI